MRWDLGFHSFLPLALVQHYELNGRILFFPQWFPLKALCHTIRADCLLMNLHATTWQMKTGLGRQLICVSYSSLPTEAYSAANSTFQALYVLYSPYLSVFLTLWLPIAEDHELLDSIINKIFALHAFNLHILPVLMPRYWASPYFLYPL